MTPPDFDPPIPRQDRRRLPEGAGPGRPLRVAEEAVALRAEPSPESGQDTQALYGELAHVLHVDEEGWAFVQLARDGYIGFLPVNALRPAGRAPTHQVCVPRTFIYPGPSMKLPILGAVPLNGQVHVVAKADGFAALEGFGFVFAAHLSPVEAVKTDMVAVAERFLHAPYLWGGKTFGGLDCSGLVQVALHACGVEAPRDTDMMVAELGTLLPVDLAAPVAAMGLQRGDLIFWKGHVGIMQSPTQLLHANGHHMMVASEPLEAARARILAKSFGPMTAVRRVGRVG